VRRKDDVLWFPQPFDRFANFSDLLGSNPIVGSSRTITVRIVEQSLSEADGCLAFGLASRLIRSFTSVMEPSPSRG
jgi:hypothetical protein